MLNDITLYEFNLLNNLAKCQALCESGVLVLEGFEGETGYNLYQVNHIYVEVRYNAGLNADSKFTSFKSTQPSLNLILVRLIYQQLLACELDHYRTHK